MEERDLGRYTCGILIELINNFGARCKSYEACCQCRDPAATHTNNSEHYLKNLPEEVLGNIS